MANGVNYSGGFVGVGTASPQAALDVNGEFRVIGSANPASGAGVEMQYYSGSGALFAYDRTANGYKPLAVTAARFNLTAEIRPVNLWMLRAGLALAPPLLERSWISMAEATLR